MNKQIFTNILNSNLSLLCFGFLFTSIVGQHLNSTYQDESWKREKRYELFKQEIKETSKVVEDITNDISKRVYIMQKYIWILENEDIEKINLISREYREVKDLWNIKVLPYENKLKKLVDIKLSKKFNSKNKTKETIQRSFKETHSKLSNWKKCIINKCYKEKKKQVKLEAKISFGRLVTNIDYFLNDLYRISLSSKYEQLHKLD